MWSMVTGKWSPKWSLITKKKQDHTRKKIGELWKIRSENKKSHKEKENRLWKKIKTDRTKKSGRIIEMGSKETHKALEWRSPDVWKDRRMFGKIARDLDSRLKERNRLFKHYLGLKSWFQDLDNGILFKLYWFRWTGGSPTRIHLIHSMPYSITNWRYGLIAL